MKTDTLSQLFALRVALLSVVSVAVSSIFLAAPLISQEAAPEAAGVILVEAEDFYAFCNMGGQPIAASTPTCDGGTSGGRAVDGLDYMYDYIQMGVRVPASMAFRNSLCSCGDPGYRRKFVIEFYPLLGGQAAGPPPDTLTTPVGGGIT